MKSISTFLRLNRHLLVGSVVVAALMGFAPTAQAQSPPPAQQISPAAEPMKAERNSRSVARTGATVPNPGTAKTGPQTEVERRAKERSTRAIRTICSGCL